MAPGFPLAVVDLAQVQNMPLHYTPISQSVILDNAPTAVFLAIFDARLHPKKHAAIVYKR